MNLNDSCSVSETGTVPKQMTWENEFRGSISHFKRLKPLNETRTHSHSPSRSMERTRAISGVLESRRGRGTRAMRGLGF